MSTLDLKNNNRYDPIEKVYAEKSDLGQISKPTFKKRDLSLFYKIGIIIVLIIILFLLYYIFVIGKKDGAQTADNWFAVKLTNGETYFGRIEKMSADPVVLENVYYNYDQKKLDLSALSEDKNLRLVKRGQETHGPTGTMMIFRDQIAYIESLKADSKVLNAILSYEK